MSNSWMKTITVITALTFALCIGQAFATEYEEVIYYHNDALGSPIVATDASGNVKWREEYSPYGSRLLHESREVDAGTGAPVESPWDEKQWFTGKLEETRVGIQYYGARWYEPELGRFLSPDPVQFTESNIFSFNRYAYANNNPYRYTDPDGESPIDVIFLAVDVGRLAAAVVSGDQAAVQAAAVDVAFSVVGVVSPIPGLGQAAKVANGARKAKKFASATSGVKKAVTKSAPEITKAYKRPSGATNKKMRDSVQGKPCVKCGDLTNRQVAGHKKALVEEYYETGSINKKRMRSLDAIQPECPTCSAREGADMSRYSRKKKKDLGL